jgi:cyclopropane-fatty-acyl-phospholipid synthase
VTVHLIGIPKRHDGFAALRLPSNFPFIQLLNIFFAVTRAMNDLAILRISPNAAAVSSEAGAPIPNPTRSPPTPPARESWFDGVARTLVLARLRASGLPLTLVENGVTRLQGAANAPVVTVLDPRFWRTILLDGTNGSGESYRDGYWTVADLTGLVRWLCQHEDALRRIDSGMGRLAMPFHAMRNWFRRNTKRGSQANIHAHYDLGNTFFARWLDSSLMYSSAWFAHPGESLEAAQEHKLDRLFDHLDLRPGEHLVEIGSGWGGLALRAAQTRGVRVTTVTISREQHALATARVAAAGLSDRIEVRLCDYRDLTGTYDKLVSVEMIEAVGHQFYETFFATVQRLLKPTGAAVIQAITLRDQWFARAARESDFIKRHIFPGSCIPSPTALLHAVTRASDLNLITYEDFAPHYALTLKRWQEAFTQAEPALDAAGYDARFRRLWHFYLSYCGGGFAERSLGVAHLLLARPGWRAPHHGALVDGPRQPTDPT